ncbi:hypothetical protein EHO59_08915 [Leptospira semungkisensis]|uniref:Uncharacterized protein n=1 Tax=Leptospira semungkisensis TaxID=2484985 RepID=A0A4R9G1J6_9LEPT|nr:hypothetical protein EHO59_08915 [Leptospira semungkisensis]
MSPNPENRVILAAESSSCKIHSVQPYWAFLGGLVPAWKSPAFFGLIPALNSSLPDPPSGQTIRVTETARWYDYTITILLGWLFTITKRTYIVEFCEEGLYANHWNDQKESIEQKLYRVAMSGNVTIQMNSGETLLCKILGFDSESIIVESSTPDAQGKVVDRAILKDGTVVEGRFTTQNEHEVEIETKTNELQFILKSRLQKLELRVPVRIIERKTLRKSEIQKLTFESAD